MDTLNIVVLAGIVSAFTIFAGVLAYAERATRNLHRERQLVAPQPQTSIAPSHRKAA